MRFIETIKKYAVLASLLFCVVSIQAHDQRSDVYVQKAQNLLKQGKFKEAIKAAESALNLSKRGDAYHLKARCYMTQKDHAKAITTLKALLDQRMMPHSPKRDYVHYLIGVNHRWQDNTKEARKHFAKALELNPKSARNRFALTTVQPTEIATKD